MCDCIRTKFTIFFDAPFWVGVCEKITGDKLEVARVVFGSEPKDYDVYDFILRHFSTLRFSPAVKTDTFVEKKANPKRIQREINEQLSHKGIGTKAQQALKLQQEECKTERRHKDSQKREMDEQRKFELRQEKKKQKHKGR